MVVEHTFKPPKKMVVFAARGVYCLFFRAAWDTNLNSGFLKSKQTGGWVVGRSTGLDLFFLMN